MKIIFFLSNLFILFLASCIPLPPFTGLEIENKSDYIIFIYSGYNATGYVISPGEKAVVEVEYKTFTLFIPACKTIKQYQSDEKLLDRSLISMQYTSISDSFFCSRSILYTEAIFDNSLELYISDNLQYIPINIFKW